MSFSVVNMVFTASERRSPEFGCIFLLGCVYHVNYINKLSQQKSICYPHFLHSVKYQKCGMFYISCVYVCVCVSVVAVTVQGVPEGVQPPVVTALSPSSLHVSWSEPTRPSGVIQRYHLNQTGVGTIFTHSDGPGNYTVTGEILRFSVASHFLQCFTVSVISSYFFTSSCSLIVSLPLCIPYLSVSLHFLSLLYFDISKSSPFSFSSHHLSSSPLPPLSTPLLVSGSHLMSEFTPDSRHSLSWPRPLTQTHALEHT